MVPLRRPALLGAGVLAAPRRPARQTIVYVLAGQHASAGRRGSRVGLARELPLQPMTDARILTSRKQAMAVFSQV